MKSRDRRAALKTQDIYIRSKVSQVYGICILMFANRENKDRKLTISKGSICVLKAKQHNMQRG